MIQVDDKSTADLAAELTRLQQIHERYRHFADNARDVLYVMSLPSHSYTYVNPATSTTYGYDPDEFLSSPALEHMLVHPGWIQGYREYWAALVAGRQPDPHEYKIVHRSGAHRWVRQSSTVVKDKDGNAVAVEGIVADVTARRQAEEAHEQERTRTQLYLDIVGVMLVGLDEDGRITLINRKGLALLGYESDSELIGKVWFDTCLPQDTAESVREKFRGLLSGEVEPSEGNERKILTRSGEIRLISWHNTLIRGADGRPIGTLSSGEDITERKKTEDSIRENEQRLRFLSDAAFEGIVISQNGSYVDANEAFLELFGYQREALLGVETLALVAPEDRAKVAENIRSGYEGVYEIRGVAKDGRKMVLEVRGRNIDYRGGKARVTAVRDVSNKKRAEETSLLLQTAIDQAAESVLITDADATIEYANPAVQRLSGYTPEEIIGESPRIFASGQQGEKFFRDMWKTLRQGEVWKGQLISKRKDGSIYDQRTAISPVRDESGRITNFVSVGRDVTHEAELEARLRQAQKMEARGTLAGGIAHDFNNLLQAMLGYADLVKSDLPEGSPTTEFIDQVISAGDRAVELVAQILAFSRQTDREQRPIRLQTIVKETLKLLRPSLPSTIEIVQQINADCSPIVADVTEIHQAVMNLCTNAYYAMRENGGTLNVRVDEVHVGPDTGPGPQGLAEGKYVSLTVADTGVGMDEPVLARAFDPYFTTKPVGEGTGMGLATVLGVAEKNGGTVTADTELGKGSTFQLYWPAASLGSPSEQPKSKNKGDLSGTEQLLLVDDEELVLGQAKAGLERLGYRVEARTSSIEALKAFEAAPDRFDVIVTDQTMPNLTGLDLARSITDKRPNTPIILCSGFSDFVDDARAKTLGIRGFVRKPMLTTDLAAEIRRALQVHDKE